ncbi:MAG: hypothetical protein HOP02_15560 [Methylococcaceae bacterium]|nr:hypothetical protein [Methylococcaceae bacterium]
MNLQKPIIIIILTALISIFTIKSIAFDDASKDDAVKDTGVALLNHVPGCVLTIVNPDVMLYSNRSLQGIPIAKVPMGNYRPVDYKLGWFKIRAEGWIAWIKDPSYVGERKSAVQKNNCPHKN